MNTKTVLNRGVGLVALALLVGLVLGGVTVRAVTTVSQPAALGTGFSYQGRLVDDGTPYSGTCTVTFKLWDAASSGSQIGGNDVNAGVSVTDGLFTTMVNTGGEFGPQAFNGAARWLDITVECAGDGGPTALGRQPISPTPYALFAERFGGYQNVIVVAQAKGDFTSVAAALAAIGTSEYPAASSSNRYLIFVAPGTYTGRVTMIPYVDIEGAGVGLTMLQAAGGANGDAASATVVGADNAELRTLTVENTGGAAWGIGLYLLQDTIVRNVQINATANTESRGILADGNAEVGLYDVVVSASGASAANYGIDAPGASFTAERVTGSAEGGNIAVGINLGSAPTASTFTQVSGQGWNGSGTTRALAFEGTVVTLADVTATVNTTTGTAEGVYCTGEADVTVRDATVAVEALTGGGSATGVRGVNCALDLRDSTMQVYGTPSVTGLYVEDNDAGVRQIYLADVEITATGGTAATGVYFNTAGSGELAGPVERLRVTNTADGSGTFAGVLHAANGSLSYRGLIVTTTGNAGNGAINGVQVIKGLFSAEQVDITASGTAGSVNGIVASATGLLDIFAVEITTLNLSAAPATTSGVTTDNTNLHQLRLVFSEADGQGPTYGFWFKQGNIQAGALEAIPTAQGTSAVVYGVYCGNGSAGPQLVIDDSVLVASTAPGLGGSISAGTGLYANACQVVSRNLAVRINATAMTQVVGVRLSNWALARLVRPAVEVGGGGTASYALYVEGVGTLLDPDVLFVNEGTLTSLDRALYVTGASAAVVFINQATVESQAASTYVAGSTATCTGIVANSGFTYAFTAGPATCP